ncbi:MAG: hypothetical protein FJW94_07465 [Actinobacteria bacterium]|nr:hypothetical protein [Actinomycetota bacterium]
MLRVEQLANPMSTASLMDGPPGVDVLGSDVPAADVDVLGPLAGALDGALDGALTGALESSPQAPRVARTAMEAAAPRILRVRFMVLASCRGWVLVVRDQWFLIRPAGVGPADI